MTFGTVMALRRYPVKSMLGEDLAQATLTTSGFEHDREFAVIDDESGLVASAKRPRLWRTLLQCHASAGYGAVRITLPDGRTVAAVDPGVEDTLSRLLGRPVHLSDVRPAGATLARPDPEDIIEHGDDAEVPFQMLEIGQGTSGTTFVDYAPVHLVTTTTLDQVGAELVRYRPNLVIATPSGVPYAENGWVGREITIGDVRLRGILPTPRCAIPTLEHGDLPRRTNAVRALLEHNRVDLPGFGVMPCMGLYAEVVVGGVVRIGEEVQLP